MVEKHQISINALDGIMHSVIFDGISIINQIVQKWGKWKTISAQCSAIRECRVRMPFKSG